MKTGLAALTIILTPVAAMAEEPDDPVAAGGADPLPNWSVDAIATTRTEYFDDYGAAAQSPFPDTGLQTYTDAELLMSRRFSPFEHVEIEAAGVLNDSDYRLANEKGLVLERFHAAWEKGDAGIPFRARGGDFFAEASPRTIGRALRGAQVEFQPSAEIPGLGPDAAASVLVFAGQPAGVWRDVPDTVGEDVFVGASGLLALGHDASVSLNAVYNSRDGEVARLDGTVISIAGERGLQFGPQDLTLETEFALYNGDHDGGGGVEQDKTDTGVLLSLSGHDTSRPLSYSARYERYGGDFRPQGAAVGFDREAIETRAAWRFDGGLQVSGRALRFIDGLDSDNQRTTRTFGAGLSGPVPVNALPGAAISADAFITDADDEAGTIDVTTLGARLDLGLPLTGGRLARLSLDAQNFNDELGEDSRSFGARLGVDMPMAFAGWRGTAAPFAYVRDRSGSSALSEAGAGVGIVLARGPSTLDLSASAGLQGGAVDGAVYDLTARYARRSGRHTFGTELELLGRETDPGGDGGGLRVGVFYSIALQKPARAKARGQFLLNDTPQPSAAPADAQGLVLAALAPGLPLEGAAAILDAAGVGPPVEIGATAIHETVVFPRLPARQRLVLRHESDRIALSAVIIDPESASGPFALVRALDIVRRAVGRTLGAPDRSLEEGQFTDNPNEDINEGRVMRVYEWSTASGIVRLGLPRRTDRTVRIELVHARNLPPLQQEFWSIEEVR